MFFRYYFYALSSSRCAVGLEKTFEAAGFRPSAAFRLSGFDQRRTAQQPLDLAVPLLASHELKFAVDFDRTNFAKPGGPVAANRERSTFAPASGIV